MPYDFPAFAAKIAAHQPLVVAFTSKEGAKVFARHLGKPAPGYGPTGWTVAGRPAYALPSPSGANRTPTDPPRIEWWRRLADFIEEQAPKR